MKKQLLLPMILLLFLSFAICTTSHADDIVLRKLSDVRITVDVPKDSGPLSFQIRNMLELKLRQVGLRVTEEAITELRLIVIWVDIDPHQKSILGKYGTVQLLLHEPVTLIRDPKIKTAACTWEGMLAVLHGPPDSFSDRTRQWTSDLADEFLNKWMKERETKAQQTPPPYR